MKRLTKSTRWFLATALCLSVLVQFNVLPEIVLCLGDDGHIEFELSIDNKCGPGALPLPANEISLNSDSEEHCGDCSDIPLVYGPATLANQPSASNQQNVPDQPCKFLVSVISNSYFTKPAFHSPTPPLPVTSQSQKGLRTIRLLV